MAAKNSREVADGVIEKIECPGKREEHKPCPALSTIEPATHEVDTTVRSCFRKCVKDEQKALITFNDQASVGDCELEDRIALLDRIIDAKTVQTLQLRC